MKGLPADAITLGLLLSHEQGSKPLDTQRLMEWFLQSPHGSPSFIGSADTLPALRIALELAELSQMRIDRVRPYPELSIASKKHPFAYLSVVYKILADAKITYSLCRLALGVTDNRACIEQIWKWIGHVPKERSLPTLEPGSLIEVTFSPDHPCPHPTVRGLVYHYPLRSFVPEGTTQTPA